MDRDEVINTISAHGAVLRSEHSVASLSIFGSVARNEAAPDSDVDILVEFVPEARVGIFAFLRLKGELERLLGRSVDLATKDALRPSMRAQIMREAVRAA